MPIDTKHIDFEIPGFAEADPITGLDLATIRPVGIRPVGVRPPVIRPTAGAGATTIIQAGSAGFTQRPVGGGVGMLVSMVQGSGGRHIEHTLQGVADVLHCRFMVSIASAVGGSVTVMRGVDALDAEVWKLELDVDTRVVTVTLATGPTFTATMVDEIPWHCVELAIDTLAGKATLWIDGVELDSHTAAMASLVSSKIQFGGITRDTAVTGSLLLDEWFMASSYIGPVPVLPVVDDATDPAKWLVVYNRDVAESVTWAQAYRVAHAIPYINMAGLPLPTAEAIDPTQWASMKAAITGYIANNGLSGQIAGVLIGFRAPGVATIGVVPMSTASLLADVNDDGLDADNTHYAAGIVTDGLLPNRDTLYGSGKYLTAEINADTLADALALITRPTALVSLAADGQVISEMDPVTDRIAVPPVPGWVQADAWLDDVDSQRPRLIKDNSFDGSDHGHAIELSGAIDGAFTVAGQTRVLMVSVGTDSAADINAT